MQEREKIKYEKLRKCSATLHSLQFEIHFDKHSWCARNFWTFTVQHEILLSSSRSHNKTMNAKPMAEETQDDLCQIDREMRRKNSKMQTKILPYLTELADERLVTDTGKYIRDTMILLTMCKGCCGYNTCLCFYGKKDKSGIVLQPGERHFRHLKNFSKNFLKDSFSNSSMCNFEAWTYEPPFSKLNTSQ